MGSRKEIVLNYNYDENWIGGTYYVQNLIHALQTLEEEDKPILFIKTNNEKSLADLQATTSYPHLKSFTPYNTVNKAKRAINKISRKINQKNVFPFYKIYDAYFPAITEKENLEKQLFWIPDFQERHLPHFFSEKEIEVRDNCYKNIAQKAHFLIFSSQDAQKDFNQYYPNAKPQQFILNFATFHDNHQLSSKEVVFDKFGITEPYFLCSNQFWIHKNHGVVLNAIAILKSEQKDIQVVFTGKENDYRNPDYFENLKKQIEELGIEDNVKFLGFIDRKDQIVLLQNCKSIIQPSLFEGWSTVNEDAKAENAFILASDLEVNKEQLHTYPNYRLFNPHDAESLANQIKKDNFATSKIDYSKDLKKFGESFIEIIKKIGKN